MKWSPEVPVKITTSEKRTLKGNYEDLQLFALLCVCRQQIIHGTNDMR